ncbi:MAG: hypothetical protein EAX95_16270 [Candidatus Thorarchaeota archaeon]|nr:hypothetical protein [Candidatus Thorarchaeota archaeon]
MKIHDITLEVDLSRHDPNHPGEEQDFDGTSIPKPDTVPIIDNYIEGAQSTTDSWWTGPWPVLHVLSMDQLVSGALYVLQLAVDFLGDVVLEALDLVYSAANELNSLGLETLARDSYRAYQMGIFSHLDIVKWTIETLLISVDYLSTPGALLPPPIYQILCALLGAAATLLIVWLYAIHTAIDTGVMDIRAALPMLLEMMLFTIGVNIASSYAGRTEFLAKFWQMRGLLNVGERVNWGSVFHILNVAVKVFFFIICLTMFQHYLGPAISQYT